jgi:hypothetical protein
LVDVARTIRPEFWVAQPHFDLRHFAATFKFSRNKRNGALATLSRTGGGVSTSFFGRGLTPAGTEQEDGREKHGKARKEKER